jgi:hypothetical protein
MSLPASLLQHVEQHGCFSGCYGSESDVSICLDPNRPLQPEVVVSCKDCLARVGVLRSHLPAGTSSYGLADLLTQHLRSQRGFTLAFSGYHVQGPGFWLSAAYYGKCGLFLISGERSRSLGSDLDLLLLAFRHGVVQAPDKRMLDPKQFTTQTVYVNFVAPITPIASRQDLLSSPHCRQQARPGWQKVTLAEFQPLAAPPPPLANPAVPVPKAAGALAGRTLKIGDICPVCGAEVRERSLLQGTFIGCLC